MHYNCPKFPLPLILKGKRRFAMACAWDWLRFLWSSTIGAAARLGSVWPAEGKDQPYVIEYYYKAKWGHARRIPGALQKEPLPRF